MEANERAKREVRRRRRKDVMRKLTNNVVQQKRKLYPVALIAVLILAALFIKYQNLGNQAKSANKTQPAIGYQPKKEKEFKPAVENLTILVKKIQPAVVTIISYDMDRKVLGQGSGFFVDKKGYLITNYHVLKGAHNAEVKTYDGNKYPVKLIIGENKTADLIKVLVDIPAESVQWVTVTKTTPDIAERILVVGSPMGLEQTVSEGIISGFRELPTVGKFYQISAPISPGD